MDAMRRLRAELMPILLLVLFAGGIWTSRSPPVMPCMAVTRRPSGPVIERMMITVSARPARLASTTTTIDADPADSASRSAC